MPQLPNESDAARINRALSEANVEAEKRQADETVEGGRFLVEGILVNHEGRPLNVKQD